MNTRLRKKAPIIESVECDGRYKFRLIVRIQKKEVVMAITSMHTYVNIKSAKLAAQKYYSKDKSLWL